jgi:outer membrane biosynthesis protein TonB
MSPAFEREKNLKALTYTGMVCGALLIIFFFAKWTLPQIPPPAFEEGIEVNLGNSDEGLGDEAPMIPGEPSASDDETYTPPATSQAVAQDEPDIQADENETDAPEISKPAVKPVPKKVPVNNEVVAKPKPNTTPVTNPTPKPPTPKAVYKGGTSTGTGGNNADSYNNSRNQGIAGGRGDQGNPDGNPNSDSYKGNASSGNSGVRIRSGLGGRRFTSLPSFEDDFAENAKVAVNITVDKSGNVTSASINLGGTTTTNAGIKAIALRKARQLKLNAGSEDDQTGTIVFDFKLRG